MAVARNLLDARLKTAEAHAHQKGHDWLKQLCRRKRQEAAEAAIEVVPDPVRQSYRDKQARYRHGRQVY